MAEILIRGMEMPAEDHPLFITIHSDGRVTRQMDIRGIVIAEAIELPPHGDLVSKDDVKRIAWYMQTADDVRALHDAADAMPVIVPEDDEID